MSKFKFTRWAAIALVLALAMGSMTPAFADGGGSDAASAPLGKISVNGNSYFELKQIDLLPDQGDKLATFTVTIHNNGSNELLFIDYWVRLMNKSGSQFSARLLPEDKDKNRISPGSSEELTFYANVNATTELSDLVVQFIKWDFSQPNFERVLGEVSVPGTYSNVTPSEGSRTISVNGTDVSATVTKLVSNKNEKYYVPTVYLEMENVGTHSVTMPAYLFAIRTSEGLMYPLESKVFKDLVINPKESKEVQFSGSIPVTVSTDAWQLVITRNIADLKLNLPVAFFELSKVSALDGGSVGQEYSFKSEDGVYTARLNALYRLPWEDQDILTADLTLSNKGEESLPIPELTGHFLLDGAVKVEAKLVKTSKVIGIGAGSGINFQIAGKIPYTYEFSKVKLVLQEKESDTVTTDVLEFQSQAELQAIPFHNKSESYTLVDTGRKSRFKVRSVSTYTGNTASLFSAQVEVENLEKRFTNIAKLVAHFRTQDGIVLPASVMEVKNKVSPNGKALLNVWATFPKGFSAENMHLLLGESVTEGKLTEGDGKPDSYVKPVAFWLPEENTDVKNVLTLVELFPYTFTMNRIGTSINGSNFKLKFNYELTKELLTETNPDGHKLVIKFEDGNGNKSFEKAYEVKDFDPKDTDSAEDSDSKLKLGKHEDFEINLSDPDLIYKTTFLKQYTLSIYDEFQGQRKQLASQKIDWFVTTD